VGFATSKIILSKTIKILLKEYREKFSQKNQLTFNNKLLYCSNKHCNSGLVAFASSGWMISSSSFDEATMDGNYDELLKFLKIAIFFIWKVFLFLPPAFS
jgi:hypothetical protein